MPKMQRQIYVKNPICSMFHVRQESEFIGGKFNPSQYRLKDCVENQCLHFGVCLF